MSLKSISVVVPCYNAEKTIQKCIESILEGLKNIEEKQVIIVDNNSTDLSSHIIKKYEGFGVRYVNESRQGRSYARNRGILESKCNYIAFVDADVYVDKTWFEVMLQELEMRSAGGGQSQIIPSKSEGCEALNRYRYKSTEYSTNGTFILLSMMQFETPMINSAACMYLKEALDLVGGFDTNLERHEDIDLSKRVFLSGYDLVGTEKTSVEVVFHGNGWMDFLIRTFSDGYYKVNYLNKWSFLKKKETKKGRSLWKKGTEFLLKRDLFLFQGFVLSCVKTLGKLVGTIINSHNTEKRPLIVSERNGSIYFDNYYYKSKKGVISFQKLDIDC